MSSPFSQQALNAARQEQAPAAAPKAPAAESPDIYRTFSPSDVAFWDFARPKDGLGRKMSMGFVSGIKNLFGFGGGSGGGAAGGSDAAGAAGGAQ